MTLNAVNQAIATAVAILRSSPNVADEAVYKALVAEGIERQLAARLVEFLPMVYCRLILARSGARFPDTYRRRQPSGNLDERSLSLEPVWNAAMEFARTEIAGGASKESLLSIAGRSADFDAANQLLNKGSKLENIVFTPAVFGWPEKGPPPEPT